MTDKLNIALLLPLYDGRNHSQFLGIGYISHVLKRANYNTIIVDEDAVYFLLKQKDVKAPFSSTKKYIVSKLHEYSPDIIGITINTANYERSLELLIKIRDCFPETTIIVGGPHISTSWQVFKKHHQPLFDIAVIGEGENTILEICDRIASKKPLANIKGAVSSQDHDSKFEPRSLIDDLDSLPYPDRDGFRICFPKKDHSIIDEHYRSVFYAHLPGFRGKKFTRIVGSRGCDFSCTFCSPSSYWKNPITGGAYRRVRNPIKIVDEMEYLFKEGYEAFFFDDPTFPFKSQPFFYRTILDELKKRSLKINWAAPTRADELSKEILCQLAESGFTYTYFGLETCQQKDLIKMNKYQDIDFCLQLLDLCYEFGIHCDVSCQIGLPKDNYDSIIKNIQWLEENKLQKRSFFSIAAIWPETPLAKQFGITSEDFEPTNNKKQLESNGLYYFKPGNPQIERFFSNCSGCYHFIDEETAINVKYYLIDSGFIKRFESK